MAEANLAKKLGIKPGLRLLVLNAPPGYVEGLAGQPGAEQPLAVSY